MVQAHYQVTANRCSGFRQLEEVPELGATSDIASLTSGLQRQLSSNETGLRL